MLSALLLLLHTLCYPLRLGSTGSFPRPLKAEEIGRASCRERV